MASLRDTPPSEAVAKEAAQAAQPAPEIISLDSGLWQSFATARNEAAFLTAWLALLVSRMPGARLGAVLEADHAKGAFLPRAVVPDPRSEIAALAAVAETALSSGRPASEQAEGCARVAYPVRAGDAPVALVAVVEFAATTGASVQAALRDMHWAAGWLAARAWEGRARDEAGRLARTGIALDTLAAMSEQPRPEAAAMMAVNMLQEALKADQVSIGHLRGARTSPRIRLLAMSHAAWFKRRSALAEGIETAMEECFDQGATVAAPPLPGAARAIRVAHEEHLRQSRTRHMLSVPLPDGHGFSGVLSAERRGEAPFSEEDRLTAEAVAALIGPVLDLKTRNRRWLGGRIIDGTLHVLGILLGPRRLSWKLLGVALAALAVAAATVQAPFRVQADAVLRGAESRAAVAPFPGFVAVAPLRAGDRVEEGALLARLDDADLRLEELRWRSEIDRLSAQGREALARYDRAQVALLETQIAQARAQLRLTEARLARTRITAPITGIVVSGDLSQRLGAPVQAGEVLFEVAPAEGYRIDLAVDERDLRFLVLGQGGRMILTGAPDAEHALTLRRLTPLAEVRDGRNTFRAEAELAGPGTGLRPGMEGVARIEVDDRLVSWIWTRRLVDWAARTLWTWQP